MVRLLFLAFISIAFGGFSIPLTSASHNLGWLLGLPHRFIGPTKNESGVCDSEECKQMAQVIKEGMDDSTDPCDDFYEYACGNWPNNHVLSEHQSSWSLWDTVYEKIQLQIKNALEAERKPTDLMPVKLAKKWYETCMDTDAMEKHGIDSILSTLFRNGGWPLIMEQYEWAEEIYKWQTIDDNYARLTVQDAFYDILVVTPEEMGTLIIIHTPHFPPRSYKLHNGWRPRDTDDTSNEDNDDGDSESKESSSDEDDQPSISRPRKTMVKKVRNNRHVHKNKVQRTNARHPGGAKNKKNRKHSTKTRVRREATYEGIHRAINRKRHPRAQFPSRQNSHIIKNSHKTPLIHRRNNLKKDIDSGENDDAGNSATEYDNVDASTTESTNTDEDDSDEIDREELVKQHRKEYAEYILQVAQILAKARGSNIQREKLEKDIEDMVQFQVSLYELSILDIDYDNTTLGAMQEAYDAVDSQTANGKVNWQGKVQDRFMDAGVEVDGDTDVIVVIPKYLNGLRDLLDKTPSETIVNYIHWNFLSKMLHATTKELRNLSFKWGNPSWKEEEEEQDEWWKQCIDEVQMTDIVGYEYVRRYFSDEILETAVDMIDEIQKEVEYQVKESNWLDADTRDFILDKLVNMKKLVGYPDWYRNVTIVKQYYRGLFIGSSYFENIINYMRYSKWKDMRALVDEDNIDKWYIDPVTLNAFFMPTENSITLTAADFQFPFFSFKRPQGINFAIIGSVMAHEVNHGFDDSGHLYDKNGDIMEWLSAMADAYNRRAECFVDQFNGYSIVKGENATIEDYGNQTAGENIADTMGLQAAFRAYKRRERECGKPDPALPGLQQLTNDQLFFLSFANLWCEVADPAVTKRQAQFDEHSIGRLRVIGSVSNSEDFAKAFHCPSGSPMNPVKKCNIWK